MMINILIILGVTALGLMGGQPAFSKSFRRIGIMLIAIGASLRLKKKKWRSTLMTWLGVVLSMGYGESSSLSKIAPKDWQRRIIYGLLLSIPFGFFGVWVAYIALPIAFSIRIPYSFKVMGFEVLPEDIVRYMTLGYCITLI